ncbi:hypothetical protein GGS24DRAFT_261977 [Hypoxylon argillaceum]|nr:hypothetical protein GGS24DRAFT_261977 [Hypoxylon argillaceum]
MLLYLLERIPADEGTTIEIGEASWGVGVYDLDTYRIEDIPFICLSYVWGSGKEPNPFYPGFYISDRAKPALAAVVAQRSASFTRIWVDAYCLPAEQTERFLLLQRMGYIFSHAQEVVTVLSSAAFPVIESLCQSNPLSRDHLAILEREEWVSRAWTYQEALNSQCLLITCERLDSKTLYGRDLLNYLVYALEFLFEGNTAKEEKKALYPNLAAFESLILDYMVAGVQKPSALQVMSHMDRRRHHLLPDYYFAMTSAVSTECRSFEATDRCDAFMIVCEDKGDYSFIYSAVRRHPSYSRRWRPASAPRLPPVLTWRWNGNGQPGHIESGKLYLDDMVVLQCRPLQEMAKTFITAKLEEMRKEMGFSDSSDLEVTIYAALESMGFEGSPDGISTTHGFFFPYKRVLLDNDITILVAAKLESEFGSPGLIEPGGEIDEYVPGVFFGRIDKREATSVKMI